MSQHARRSHKLETTESGAYMSVNSVRCRSNIMIEQGCVSDQMVDKETCDLQQLIIRTCFHVRVLCVRALRWKREIEKRLW